MLKKTKFDNYPLINWKKLWKYIKAFFGFIYFLVWTVILSTILKLILKFFILYIQGLVIIYKGISNFAKKNIKGFWVLFTIFILLIISILYGLYLMKYFNYVHQILNEQNNIEKTNIELIEENENLKSQIIEKDLKLEAKAEEERLLAHKEKVMENRNIAEEKLPQEVKDLIVKHANAYGVKDIRYMECIVFNESGGRSEAIGDSGLAVGACQYHLATFLGHRKQMGLPLVDLRKDTDACLQAMMFSISNGGIGNWSARLKCA